MLELTVLNNNHEPAVKPLVVSEMFYSIQGEGKTTGVLAYFLRLAACNLECGGIGSTKSGKIEDGATWRCDSMEVWTKGSPKTNKEIIDFFAKESDGNHHEDPLTMFYLNLANGAHIVITGGEPLLQQKRIIHFLADLFTDYNIWKRENCILGAEHPFVEVETNGTLKPVQGLSNFVSLWNVSPKLANSGMAPALRIVGNALVEFLRLPIESVQFKFVIGNKEDFFEIIESYVVPYNIEPYQICLMPACDNAADLPQISQEVIAICMANGLRFSPRLHIHIWNQKTGV